MLQSRQESASVILLHPPKPSRLPQAPDNEPFVPAVERQLAACRRYGARMAVLTVQLDGLAPLGQRHGLAVQQAVVDAAWQRMRSRVRGVDHLVRVAVDTFGVALFSVGDSVLGPIEARLFDELSAPYRVGSLVVEVMAVTGALVWPSEATSAEAVVQAAHELRLAKMA
ncbi:GGDEF domain-containing protein [Ideonella sp. BN130291]|uniref:GGDEF domain-containing protein n=1 Tax=Ideonella sp. BN130291 TaxID=3112940 RepID=UPI002E26A6EA|nr:diguanylate cyclase [Ideonella sp. BN130291]